MVECIWKLDISVVSFFGITLHFDLWKSFQGMPGDEFFTKGSEMTATAAFRQLVLVERALSCHDRFERD